MSQEKNKDDGRGINSACDFYQQRNRKRRGGKRLLRSQAALGKKNVNLFHPRSNGAR